MKMQPLRILPKTGKIFLLLYVLSGRYCNNKESRNLKFALDENLQNNFEFSFDVRDLTS